MCRVQSSMRSGILEEARGNNDHRQCENGTSDFLASSNIETIESNMDVDQPSETPKGTLSFNESQCIDLTNDDDDVTIQQQQEHTDEKLDMEIDHGTVTDEVNPPQSNSVRYIIYLFLSVVLLSISAANLRMIFKTHKKLKTIAPMHLLLLQLNQIPTGTM
jgi:hypothetical protein